MRLPGTSLAGKAELGVHRKACSAETAVYEGLLPADDSAGRDQQPGNSWRPTRIFAFWRNTRSAQLQATGSD
jgi:hypothetical protein